MTQRREPSGQRWKRPRFVAAVAFGAAAALGLAGCAPGGSSTPQASSTPVSTSVTKGQLTLFSGAGLAAFQQKLIDGFEKDHPGIKITLKTEPDADANIVESKLLASNDAPDLVNFPNTAVKFIDDKLLTNLDQYATAYGWDKLPAAQLKPFRSDGKLLGTGSLYGFAAPAGPVVGVFYNRKLAKQVGLTSAPASLEEFTSTLAKAKAAGVTPIVTANKIGLLGHLWMLMIGNYEGPDKLLAVNYNDPSAQLDGSQVLAATTQLNTWLKAGYFNKDINALDQDPSYAQFQAGKALFTIQGSWILPSVQKMVDAGNLGFFPLPPVTAGGQYTSMSGPSLAYAIPAKSKNHDAAAVFLNWVQTKTAASAAYDTGFSAQKPDATTTVGWNDDIKTQLSSSYAKISAGGGLTNWWVNATTGLQTKIPQDLQSLAGGQTQPADMLKDLQSTYDGDVK